jgi:hypothetical protein
MENFTDLKSIYSHLESNAADYKYPHQIGNLFQKLRDLKHKENLAEEVEKAQWELDFFNFVFQDNKLKSKMSWTNEKGEIVEYPDLSRFSDKTYEYLIIRAESVLNPILKARYANILWCSPKKHVKYAKMALDSYLDLILIYETKDTKEPQNHYGLDALKTIEIAYNISCQINYNKDKIRAEIKRLIHNFNNNSSSSYVLKLRLIRLVLQDKNIFQVNDIVGLEDACWEMGESLIKQKNIHAAIDMFELGEKVDAKLNKRTHDWRKVIADSYEAIMKQSEINNKSAAPYFCQKALDNFILLKDKDKIQELEDKYSKLKESRQFAEYKTDIDLTKHIKQCEELAKKVVRLSSDDIIKLLMLENKLLPQQEELERRAKEASINAPMLDLFSKEIIDPQGNPAQHFSDEEERKYHGILQQYLMNLELDKIHRIHAIFTTAIRDDKLSAPILLEFLSKHSWLGKQINKTIASKTISYDWLNLIAPSLHDFFMNMQYYQVTPGSFPNFVLCIDSLTLKFEGMVRDICHLSGITTFYSTKDNKGREIIREKNIHSLLYEEPINKLFDKDDLLLFKILLVEQSGYNLRHRVAHSFMLFHDYCINYIYLLILALLRIGKYDFVINEDSAAQ